MSDELQPTVDTGTASAPSESATPPTLDETLSRVANEVYAREPVHGANGQFQPKVVAQGAPAAPETPGQSGTAPPDPAPPVIEAPQSWPADVKGKWATLPPDVQRYIADREGETHKKFTTDGQRLKDYEGVDSALEVAKDFLESNRVPKAEYIRRLAVADHMLRTNGPQALADIARLYGIQMAAPPGGQPDPNNALTKTINDLQAQVKNLRQSSETATLAKSQETVDSFRKDAPHFDVVEALMAELIESGAAAKVPGEAPLLKKAYDLAVHLNPEVKGKIDADAKKVADEKAAQEAKERATKDAKLAPLARRPGSAPTGPVKGKNWMDTLQKVGEEVYARS